MSHARKGTKQSGKERLEFRNGDGCALVWERCRLVSTTGHQPQPQPSVVSTRRDPRASLVMKLRLDQKSVLPCLRAAAESMPTKEMRTRPKVSSKACFIQRVSASTSMFFPLLPE